MAYKALGFSDIHGHKKGLDYIGEQVEKHKPDLVLIAGDATDYSNPAASFELLDTLGVEVFLVPGNMDRFGSVSGYSNLMNIHGVREERGEIGFVGFGAVHMGDLDLAEFLAPMVQSGDVFVTHFPAKGYNDRAYNGANAGSERIARAVRELDFRMLLSGHIHESPGIIQDEGVYYVNPGPAYEHRGVLVTLDHETRVQVL
jgi:Icc-related predicted phosphoesterase